MSKNESLEVLPNKKGKFDNNDLLFILGEMSKAMGSGP